MGVSLWGLATRATPEAAAQALTLDDRVPCADASALRAKLAAATAHAGDDAQVSVQLAPLHAEDGEGIAVSVRGHAAAEPFSRTITAASCDAAAEAALLLVSLLLPEAHEKSGEPAPEPARPSARAQLDLTLGPRFDVGSLPLATAGVGGGLLLRLPRIDARLELRGLAPRLVEDDVARASARASLFSAALAAGLPFSVARMRFGPTAGVEVGLFRVRGYGLEAARTQHTAWLAALVGGAVDLALGSVWGLRGELEAALPLRVPSYGAADAAPFAESFPCVFRAALLVQVALVPRNTAPAATQKQ